MKTSKLFTYYDLRSQSIELLCWREGPVLGGQHLSLANGMHDFNPRDRTAGRPKRLKAQHRVSEPFHCSVVLFYHIVEILGVTDRNRSLVRLVVVRDRCRIGATFQQQFLRFQQRPAF